MIHLLPMSAVHRSVTARPRDRPRRAPAHLSAAGGAAALRVSELHCPTDSRAPCGRTFLHPECTSLRSSFVADDKAADTTSDDEQRGRLRRGHRPFARGEYGSAGRCSRGSPAVVWSRRRTTEAAMRPLRPAVARRHRKRRLPAFTDGADILVAVRGCSHRIPTVRLSAICPCTVGNSWIYRDAAGPHGFQKNGPCRGKIPALGCYFSNCRAMTTR
jgi:hypothetical protein